MHLADKLKLLSAGTKDFTTSLEAKADALLAKQADLQSRANAAMTAQEGVLSDAEAGVSDIEAVLKGLTNS